MATRENTSATTVAEAKGTKAVLSLSGIADDLHACAALLAGVEEICSADMGADAMHVAAKTCGNINQRLCEIANVMNVADKKGGAA